MGVWWMGVRVHTNSYQSIQTTNLPHPFPTYPPPIPTISPNSILDHDNFIIFNEQHKNSNNLCRKLNIVEFQSFEINKLIFSINSLYSSEHIQKYKEIYKKILKERDYSLPFSLLSTNYVIKTFCFTIVFKSFNISCETFETLLVDDFNGVINISRSRCQHSQHSVTIDSTNAI